jgi:hypothetical protein
MKLLEDIIIEYDLVPAGTDIQVIDEGISSWLNALGTGIKHVGRFALRIIKALANSGIDQTDIEKMTHLEVPLSLKPKIENEIEAYENKYNIQDETVKNTIVNLVKMKHTNPEMRDNAERALAEITKKLKNKEDGI